MDASGWKFNSFFQVKLWSIPKDLEELKSITPDHVIKGFDKRPELVFYHPIADGLATVITGDNVHLYDLERSEIKRGIIERDLEKK